MTTGRFRHRIQGSHDHPAPHLIRLEHVAADHHEGTTFGFRQRPDPADRLETGGIEAGLCVGRKEMPGHAQLPVGGVDESDHAREDTEAL